MHQAEKPQQKSIDPHEAADKSLGLKLCGEKTGDKMKPTRKRFLHSISRAWVCLDNQKGGSIIANLMVMSVSLMVFAQAAQMFTMGYSQDRRAKIRGTMYSIAANYRSVLQNLNYREATIQNLVADSLAGTYGTPDPLIDRLLCADPKSGVVCAEAYPDTGGVTPPSPAGPAAASQQAFLSIPKIDLTINPAAGSPLHAWAPTIAPPGQNQPLNGITEDGFTQCSGYVSVTEGAGNPECPFSIASEVQVQCSGATGCAPLFQLTVFYNGGEAGTDTQMTVQFR